MNDFELIVDILKRSRANFDTLQRRDANYIHVYNDMEEVLKFTFDEFGNIVIIE